MTSHLPSNAAYLRSQGAYEERKLAHALDLAQQTGRRGKTKRSIYITLSGGHKVWMTAQNPDRPDVLLLQLRNNSYVLRETDAEYNSRGDKKVCGDCHCDKLSCSMVLLRATNARHPGCSACSPD